MSDSKTQEQIMADAGYVPASKAAEAIGVSQVGAVHKMVTRGTLKGARAGSHWYVSVKSLLAEYKEAKPIYDRIVAIGVKPQEVEVSGARVVQPPKKRGPRRARASQ